LKRLTLKDLDDLCAALGYGGILMSQIMPKIREKLRDEEREHQKKLKPESEQSLTEFIETHTKPQQPTRTKENQGINVKGISNVLVRFAKCCNPVPGDHIIGYITRGRGVTVHRADCPNFEKSEDTENRFIEVEWIQDLNQSYLTEIQIIAPDRKGLLTEVTNLISDIKVTVVGVNAKRTKDEIAIINLSVEISDAEQLKKLMSRCRSLPHVIEVKRVTS